jgi:type II secretory pathway pseudopilin PulG
MTNLTPIRRPRPSEEGYILVVVIFMLALLMLSLSLAAPRVAKQLQRDRELETMHRGKQYIRAIQLYYRKFNTYPPTLDALVKSSNIRFLRKKYVDPTSGKNEWKPIHYGQAKTQTLGFFGQPLAGSSTTGSSVLGANSSGITSASSISASTTSTDTSASTAAASSTSTSSSGISSSSSSLSGQTFGGAGIIGFSPLSPRQSIMVYKKKNHYNEWEFNYDPLTDQTTTISSNTGTIGTSASSLSGTSTSTSTSTSSTSSSGSTSSSSQ